MTHDERKLCGAIWTTKPGVGSKECTRRRAAPTTGGTRAAPERGARGEEPFKEVAVLRSEVDASGYDVVFECNGRLRHVQLKTSKPDAKVGGRKVNVALATKPSGCIVWIVRHEDRHTCRMRLSYLFFGGEGGQPLPSLDGFKVAKHSKGNAQGVKRERPAIRVVPKSRFTEVGTTRELVRKLFGLQERADQEVLTRVEELAADDEGEDVGTSLRMKTGER